MATCCSATNGAGDVVNYTYDTSTGERILERDSAGNVVERDYSTKQQLLIERHYLVPDPDGAGSSQPTTPLVSRFAYDSHHHLVYVVSPEGRVTRYTTTARASPPRRTSSPPIITTSAAFRRRRR